MPIYTKEAPNCCCGTGVPPSGDPPGTGNCCEQQSEDMWIVIEEGCDIVPEGLAFPVTPGAIFNQDVNNANDVDWMGSGVATGTGCDGERCILAHLICDIDTAHPNVESGIHYWSLSLYIMDSDNCDIDDVDNDICATFHYLNPETEEDLFENTGCCPDPFGEIELTRISTNSDTDCDGCKCDTSITVSILCETGCPDRTACEDNCPTGYHVDIDSSEFGDCQDCYDDIHSAGIDLGLYNGGSVCIWEEYLGGSTVDPCCEGGYPNDWSGSITCVTLTQIQIDGFSEPAGNKLTPGDYWCLNLHSSGGFGDVDHPQCAGASGGFENFYSYQRVVGPCPRPGEWPIHDQSTNLSCDGLTHATVTEL